MEQQEKKQQEWFRKRQERKRLCGSLLRELVFYLVLAISVLAVYFLKNMSGGAPTSICGFSLMQVLTGSMETEIPKGSLVITYHVDPDTLKIGDDITYMKSATVTITHRIVDIAEDYADTGERAFTTQGVCNAELDKEPVAAANVVGKVIFHSYALGQALILLKENWLLALVLVFLFGVLFYTLRIVFGKERIDEG